MFVGSNVARSVQVTHLYSWLLKNFDYTTLVLHCCRSFTSSCIWQCKKLKTSKQLSNSGHCNDARNITIRSPIGKAPIWKQSFRLDEHTSRATTLKLVKILVVPITTHMPACNLHCKHEMISALLYVWSCVSMASGCSIGMKLPYSWNEIYKISTLNFSTCGTPFMVIVLRSTGYYLCDLCHTVFSDTCHVLCQLVFLHVSLRLFRGRLLHRALRDFYRFNADFPICGEEKDGVLWSDSMTHARVPGRRRRGRRKNRWKDQCNWDMEMTGQRAWKRYIQNYSGDLMQMIGKPREESVQ